MLQRREVDINIGSQSLRYDRSLVNDLSPQLLITGLAIFFKSSDAYELNAWEMLAIFNRNAWVLFVCLVAGTFVGLIMTYFIMDTLHSPSSNLLQASGFIGRSLILKSSDMVARRSWASKTIYVAVGLLSVVMFAYLRAGRCVSLPVPN